MTTHWQDDYYYNDSEDEWWDHDSDDYYNPYGSNDDLFPDDYDDYDYYEESRYESTLQERLINLPNRIRWNIANFWNYTLGMKKCSICGRRRRQGCTDDCIPF